MKTAWNEKVGWVGDKLATGDRKFGWMAVDYAENAVGFIPDGTEFNCDLPDYDIEVGYFKDKRNFAYPIDDAHRDCSNDLKNRHKNSRDAQNA